MSDNYENGRWMIGVDPANPGDHTTVYVRWTPVSEASRRFVGFPASPATDDGYDYLSDYDGLTIDIAPTRPTSADEPTRGGKGEE